MNGMMVGVPVFLRDAFVRSSGLGYFFMESNNDRNATWALELNVRYHSLSVHYGLTWCFSNKYNCRVMFLKMIWQSIEVAALCGVSGTYISDHHWCVVILSIILLLHG